MSWLRRGNAADDDGPTGRSTAPHSASAASSGWGSSSAWGSSSDQAGSSSWGSSSGSRSSSAWGSGPAPGSSQASDSGPGTAPGAGPADSPSLAVNPQEPPRRLVYVLALGLSAIWLLLDQATKVLALAGLGDGGTVSLGPVDLTAVKNQGGAFGLDPGFFPGLFIVVTLAVLLLIARALPRTDRLSLAAAYGLIGGGALGNLVDRLFREPGFPRGAVVDFIDLGWWPVFNVADVGIVVGALVLALLLVKVDRQERAAQPPGNEGSRADKHQAKVAKRQAREAKREAKREKKGKTSPADGAAGHANASTAAEGARPAAQEEPAASGS